MLELDFAVFALELFEFMHMELIVDCKRDSSVYKNGLAIYRGNNGADFLKMTTHPRTYLS